MTYCFDIDGTLCTNTEGQYALAQPDNDMICSVNELFDTGHTILLYTARGSTTGIDWSSLTTRQLTEWGVKYHTLYFGKPSADIYVDDKGTNVNDWKRCKFGS